MLIEKKLQGISLIEVGVVLVVISLALAPIVQMIGGPVTKDGNVTQIAGLKTREAILANAMIEKVLSGDFRSFDCDANGAPNLNFDPTTDFPDAGKVTKYGTCTNSEYNKELYFQWTILNLNDTGVNGTEMPKKNEYLQATFRVMDAPRDGNVLLTIPLNFFYNSGAPESSEDKTGIMLALDTSESMYRTSVLPGNNGGMPDWLSTDWTKKEYVDQYTGVGVPFLYYRYDQSRFAGFKYTGQTADGFRWALPSDIDPGSQLPNGLILNKWDDSQLDLMYAQRVNGLPSPDPVPATAYNEAYPNPGTIGANGGLLGMGDCTIERNPDPTDSHYGDVNSKGYSYTAWWRNRFGWWTDYRLVHIIAPRGLRYGPKNLFKSNFCQVHPDMTDWSDEINAGMSRIEAERTAALSLLLALEHNKVILPTIELGFMNWSTGPNLQVPMEATRDVSGIQRFKAMRERLLWINRGDPLYPLNPFPNPPTDAVPPACWYDASCTGGSDAEDGPPPETSMVPRVMQTNQMARRLELNILDAFLGGNAWAAPPPSGQRQSIIPSGATRIDLALADAKAELLSKPYTRRILILVTDGKPEGDDGSGNVLPYQPASNTEPSLVAQAYAMGNGEPDKKKQITIFTVGIIEADEALMTKIADQTPSGISRFARDVADLGPIFDELAYQAQKLALLNTADRFGIDLE